MDNVPESHIVEIGGGFNHFSTIGWTWVGTLVPPMPYYLDLPSYCLTRSVALYLVTTREIGAQSPIEFHISQYRDPMSFAVISYGETSGLINEIYFDFLLDSLQ